MIREALRRYLTEKLDLPETDFTDSTLLFSEGVLDSFHLVELMDFFELEFGVAVHPGDISLENFDSIERMVSFVERKVAER